MLRVASRRRDMNTTPIKKERGTTSILALACCHLHDHLEV